jgi:hypothetical protein
VNFGRDGTTTGKISSLETITLEEKSLAAEQIGISATVKARSSWGYVVDDSNKPLSHIRKYEARGCR